MGLDYYNSAIRYTDFDRKTVFVDLGCGAGKTIIQACETQRFDFAGGVELLLDLKILCDHNLTTMSARMTKSFSILGNCEESDWALTVTDLLAAAGISPTEVTIFIFNKNSYDASVLNASLKIIEKFFDSVIYLYQNPIHHHVLLSNNYTVFADDSKSNNTHKNYKYKCYVNHAVAD